MTPRRALPGSPLPRDPRLVHLSEGASSFEDRLQRVVEIPVQDLGPLHFPGSPATRITVGDVLSYLAGGMSENEILADFPQLTREDIRACLAFAAERERRLRSVPGA